MLTGLFSVTPSVNARPVALQRIGQTLYTYTSQPNSISCLNWSPNGQRVLSGSSNTRSWKALNGDKEVLYDWPDDYNGLQGDCAYSPDGSKVAIAGDRIHIFDAATGKHLRTLRYAPESQDGPTIIFALAWSPDGRYLAAGRRYNDPQFANVVIWDAREGRILHELTGHQDLIFDLAWSPDGKYLASASFDFTVRVWDVQTRQTVNVYNHAPDGSLPAPVRSLAWSPDGKRIASGTFNSDSGEVAIWDALTSANVVKYQNVGPFYSIAWSPDGKRLALGSGAGVYIISATGRLIYTYGEQTDTIAAWSPDGTKIASGGNTPSGSTVNVWRAS